VRKKSFTRQKDIFYFSSVCNHSGAVHHWERMYRCTVRSVFRQWWKTTRTLFFPILLVVICFSYFKFLQYVFFWYLVQSYVRYFIISYFFLFSSFFSQIYGYQVSMYRVCLCRRRYLGQYILFINIFSSSVM